MQTEVSKDSLFKSARRLLGDGVVLRIAYKTVGSKTLFGHGTLQRNNNVIQYALYGVLL